jgi:hypothetical protein
MIFYSLRKYGPIKVADFSKFYYHIKFQDPILKDASVTRTLNFAQVPVGFTDVKKLVKYKTGSALQWYDVHRVS